MNLTKIKVNNFLKHNNMRKTLFNLWILIPKKTACYRAGICVTETYFNWFNPLTYIYLVFSVCRICFLYLKYGKEFLNR